MLTHDLKFPSTQTAVRLWVEYPLRITMEYQLSTLQKLDLYQIIAYAKEGDSERIIERVQTMLKSASDETVTLTESQWRSLGTLSIEDVLNAALKTAAAQETDHGAQ